MGCEYRPDYVVATLQQTAGYMAAAISPHDATDKELLTFLAPHYADALMARQPVRGMLITLMPTWKPRSHL